MNVTHEVKTADVAKERRIYVGAPLHHEGWESYNDTAHKHVDHLGTLSEFAVSGEPPSIIYANNVLGRLDPQNQALRALRYFLAALRPGGVLVLAEFDLKSIAQLVVKSKSAESDLLLALLARKATFTPEILSSYLQLAGFSEVNKASDFQLFNDTSAMKIDGQPIAYVMIAKKSP